MRSISLGLLLPTSSILPISKDVERGIKEGFAQNTSEIALDLVKEFIGQGSIKQTEEAVSRFFNYHDVDVVSGVVSQRVADDVAELFQKRKMPFIVNDLGAHIPQVEKLNEYTYINSLFLWQHAWAIGKWGVETFGKKGMYVSAVYDSGYSFSQMFHAGMLAAHPQAEWSFSVCPMPPAGALSDVSVVFPFMEQYQPDFIFATFCGEETTLFLNECIARGWHKRTNIIGLPFITEPFAPLQDDVVLYSTVTALNEDAIAPARSFYQLGYETGVLLAKAAAAGGDLNSQLSQHFTGLRKGKEKETLAVDSSREIVMLRNTIKAGAQDKEVAVINTLPSYAMDFNNMKMLVSETTFGWTNPYLCV